MEEAVAIIVINYNGKEHLEECFISLSNQTYKNFEVFLLDNDSKDDSLEYTRKNFPFVSIIKMKENYGFAEGYNKAIDSLDRKFKYIVILNNDVRLDSNWLKFLVEVANDDYVTVVGSKLCFYQSPNIINSAGIKLTFIGIGFDIGFGQNDAEEFNIKKYVGGVCGASMLIKREIFEEVGGFDKDYFLLCEDTDLCWRVLLQGYKILYQPNSVVYHKVGKSIGKRETPFRIFYSQRNSLITVFKNLGLLRLIIASVIIFDYTFIKMLFYFLILRIENAKALFMGTIAFLNSLKETLRKRGVIQRDRKVSDRYLEKNHFIASPLDSLREYIRVTKLWMR